MRTDMDAAKVGDFIYTSWGYDQTNVSFYKIVGTTPSGKSLRLQQVQKRIQGGRDGIHGDPHDAVVPHDHPAERTRRNVKTGETITTPYPIQTVRRQPTHVKIDGQYGWLWDGTPKYQTGHGYGH